MAEDAVADEGEGRQKAEVEEALGRGGCKASMQHIWFDGYVHVRDYIRRRGSAKCEGVE